MIESLNQNNINICVKLANKLWPNEAYLSLLNDFQSMIGGEDNQCFLAYDQKEAVYIGFIHMAIRKDYVPGSSQSPTGFIEGIYVEAAYRMQGIAESLVNQGIEWAKEKGCKEIGSDCELDNTFSIDFHKAIGFTEVERVVFLIKTISE